MWRDNRDTSGIFHHRLPTGNDWRNDEKRNERNENSFLRFHDCDRDFLIQFINRKLRFFVGEKIVNTWMFFFFNKIDKRIDEKWTLFIVLYERLFQQTKLFQKTHLSIDNSKMLGLKDISIFVRNTPNLCYKKHSKFSFIPECNAIKMIWLERIKPFNFVRCPACFNADNCFDVRIMYRGRNKLTRQSWYPVTIGLHLVLNIYFSNWSITKFRSVTTWFVHAAQTITLTSI